jgi:hypothetical protein
MKRFYRQKRIRKLDLCCHTDLFESTVHCIRYCSLHKTASLHNVFPDVRKLRNTQDDVENRPPANGR